MNKVVCPLYAPITGARQLRLLAWNPDTIGNCHAIWADAMILPR